MGEEPQEARDRPAARLLYQLHPYHPVYIHPEHNKQGSPLPSEENRRAFC